MLERDSPKKSVLILMILYHQPNTSLQGKACIFIPSFNYLLPFFPIKIMHKRKELHPWHTGIRQIVLSSIIWFQ